MMDRITERLTTRFAGGAENTEKKDPEEVRSNQI